MTTSQIIEKFTLFLDEQISLETFEDWLMSEAWNSEEENVCEIAWDIILRFFEYSSKDLSKDELITEIKQLLLLENQEASVLSLSNSNVEVSSLVSFVIQASIPRKQPSPADRPPRLEFLSLKPDPDSHQTSKHPVPPPQNLLQAH